MSIYITDEMRSTYSLPKQYNILVDYGTFSQSEWHEWSIIKIEGMVFAAVV